MGEWSKRVTPKVRINDKKLNSIFIHPYKWVRVRVIILADPTVSRVVKK